MKTTNTMSRWRAGLAAILVIAALFPLTARADDSAARKAYDHAQQLLGSEDFRSAARAFGEFRAEHPDHDLAASAAYWEAFSLYRVGDSRRLQQARELLIEAGKRYGDEASEDREELLARIEGRLARLGDAEAAEEIQRRSEGDDDEAVRIAALNALLNMDSERALPILSRLVRDHESSAELREQAVFLISQQSGQQVSELLLEVARNDPSPSVRGQAIFWLGQAGGEEAVMALEQVLETEQDPEILGNALFALSQTDSPRAVELLSQVARDERFDDELRGNAVFWLGQKGDPEIPQLLRELYKETDDPVMKEKLIFGLSQGGTEGTSEWLLEIATDPEESTELRKTALFWAGQSGEIGAHQLMEIYRSTDDLEMKEQIIFVLSQSDSKEAVDALLELAQTETDLDLRTKAIFWLGQSDDERVVEFLGKLIER